MLDYQRQRVTPKKFFQSESSPFEWGFTFLFVWGLPCLSGTKNHIKSLLFDLIYMPCSGDMGTFPSWRIVTNPWSFTYPLGIEHDYRKLPLMISKSSH